MSLKNLDRRLNPWREDLAADHLRGKVRAERFVPAQKAHCIVPTSDLKREPRSDAGLDTQLLYGAQVSVYEQKEAWSWVQSQTDGYVGYVASATLQRGEAPGPTHWVAVPRTFAYSEPNLKTPAPKIRSMGTALSIKTEIEHRGTLYYECADGSYVFAKHLITRDQFATDYVDNAELLINTPYLWGGVSGLGIDCSGLVQLSMAMAGKTVLRDSDMQAASIGTLLPDGEDLQRGDLVFWQGHVGIMADKETLLHANAHSMLVNREPLAKAIARIAYLYGEPTAFRRP